MQPAFRAIFGTDLIISLWMHLGTRGYKSMMECRSNHTHRGLSIRVCVVSEDGSRAS